MLDLPGSAGSTVPSVEFSERCVEADGFRVLVLEAGEGRPVVWLHGAGGLHLKHDHHLLAATNRVVAIEMPGFPDSPVNRRHQTSRDMAATLATVIAAIGLEHYAIWGTSFGGRVALWLALLAPEATEKVVLEAPLAVLPEGHLIGPVSRDAELEGRMPEIQAPTLVLIGTRDRIVSPEWGRQYMRLLPNCNLMLVYDAAHEIASDRPQAFVETVKDFLERGEAFVVGQRSTVLYP